MKTKMLLVAAMIGAAALSARAGVAFGFSFGLPLPAPVVVGAPLAVASTVVVAAPACPGPAYVWGPGYWSVCGYSRVWVPGCWHYRAVYGHPYHWRR